MFDGGFCCGEQWVIGVFQYNWKFGFFLILFKYFVFYNKLSMIDFIKKFLFFCILFEDFIQINFKFLYKFLKENEIGKVVFIIGVEDDEMVKYVIEKFGINGFYI